MSKPSTQVIAKWVTESINSYEWVKINLVIIQGIRKNIPGYSEMLASEVADEHKFHVTNLLLDKAKSSNDDGAYHNFEIDEEQNEYIRLKKNDSTGILNKLKIICPFDFEEVCSKLLEKFGCDSRPTPKTRDGGIDFIAIGLDIFPDGISCPKYCKATVIGQAKRYSNSLVAEKTLREFVGASLMKRHELRVAEVISPLTPVLLAFWTTSDFDPSGREFARRAGVWLMDGLTIATYLKAWGLEDWVMSLEEVPA